MSKKKFKMEKTGTTVEIDPSDDGKDRKILVKAKDGRKMLGTLEDGAADMLQSMFEAFDDVDQN